MRSLVRALFGGKLERIEALLNVHLLSLGSAIMAVGFLWRLFYASGFYLNPDEALHYLVAAQPDMAAHGFHGWTRVAHPPLFTLILREMLRFGRAEWVLRLVPMISGAVFPWFVMLWIRRLASNAAALSAQLFLTFSPTLIDLSTEVRHYTLAFLFLSISLLMLEVALDRGSTMHMVWFHVFLYLSILTEYCVGWFVAAAGLYALLRLWGRHFPGNIWMPWLAGQAGGLALYAFLFVVQVSKWRQSGLLGDPVNTWLSASFLQPGQHVLTFALKGSLNQFKYLLATGLLAPFAAAAFAYGLFRLWRNGKPLQAMLVVLPLCLACLSGIFHLFPYGPTRHTAVLGIAVAAAFGSAVAAVARGRLLPIIAAALVIVPVWNRFAADSYFPVPRDRRRLSMMREAVQFLHSRVPAGSAIVTDRGTDMMLAYYLEPYEDSLFTSAYDMHESAGLRLVVAPSFQLAGDAELEETLSQARRRYSLDGAVWVVAGGFDIKISNPRADAAPFEKTIAIFQTSGPSAVQ